MKNELKMFEGHEVEVFEFDGEVLFNPYHVGECLGLNNDAVRKAVSRMSEKQVVKLKNSDVTNCHFRKLHNTGENFITESGVYKLVFRSRKEKAERFTNWVTDEVLPSIRKTGGYIAGQENMTDSELMAKALLVAQKQIEERNKRIEEMKPKEVFADAVADSKSTILVGDLAKILKQNGIDIGSKRLFTWMRDNGYLIKRKGSDYNMPTQKSMELGLFVIKESVYTDYYGSKVVAKTAKITGYGQQYFINQFLGDEDAEF